MANTIKLKRGTSANVSKLDGNTYPVLADGEPAYDKTNRILKIGDGVTTWDNLKGIDADTLDGHEASEYYTKTNLQTSGQASVHWGNLTDVPDPKISLNGDVHGSGTMTSLGDVTITTVVGHDSHQHSDTSINSVDWSKLLNVPSPTITLTGDVSGSATMTSLGDVSISATVADDSHTHDTRYYTETEIDNMLSGLAVSGHTHALDNMTDVTITSPSSGHVIQYDGSKWVNSAVDWSELASIPSPKISLNGDVHGSGTMTSLGDVTITTVVGHDSHNHSNSTINSVDWSKLLNVPSPKISLTGDVTGSGTMTSLGDVSITATVDGTKHTHSTSEISDIDAGTADGQLLTWDNTNEKWVATASISTSQISDIAAPIESGSSTKNLLGWDDSNSKWVAKSASDLGISTSGHSHELGDLTNVDVTDASQNNVLKFNGSAWVDGSVAWGEITGKPATYTPSTHSHTITDITNIGTASVSYASNAGSALNADKLDGYHATSFVKSTVTDKSSASADFTMNVGEKVYYTFTSVSSKDLHIRVSTGQLYRIYYTLTPTSDASLTFQINRTSYTDLRYIRLNVFYYNTPPSTSAGSDGSSHVFGWKDKHGYMDISIESGLFWVISVSGGNDEQHIVYTTGAHTISTLGKFLYTNDSVFSGTIVVERIR